MTKSGRWSAIRRRVFVLTDRRLLIIFVTLILALAMLVRLNQSNSAKFQLTTWKQCQRSHTNTQKIDSTINARIAFYRSLEKIAPKTKPSLDQLITIEHAGLLRVPDCGPRPS